MPPLPGPVRLGLPLALLLAAGAAATDSPAAGDLGRPAESGDNVAETRSEPSRSEAVPHGNPSRYRIGPDDVLRVEVIGHPEFAATATVTAGGTILLPIVHQIEVAGLTADQVQTKVTALLADGYLRDPRVVVSIAAYNNMKVWVFGEVDKPGEIRLQGPMTILELLKLVGDVRVSTGATVTIERMRPAAERSPDEAGAAYREAATITVDLERLMRQGDLSENVPLQNGDKVYIPPTSAKVGVFGAVTRPGFYAYAEGMTLFDLIQVAGGFSEYANQKKVKVKRAGSEKPTVVNLKSFLRDGADEAKIALAEGDVVLVDSSFLF